MFWRVETSIKFNLLMMVIDGQFILNHLHSNILLALLFLAKHFVLPDFVLFLTFLLADLNTESNLLVYRSSKLASQTTLMCL